MIKNGNYIFFLGGYDAEMLEIKSVLTKHNLPYFDNNLQWYNAKASEYKNKISFLDKNKIPVLIELGIDIELPQWAVIIDHHNERENEKSSIEQVAELLEIELNRWQKLIAANDKGYIPAMECLCATKEEIKKVRESDRRAQGVTEEDERLAERSIKENKEEQNGITIIMSLTEKFSPITDRMYGRTNNLLIYTDNTLAYYGERKKQIVNKFKNLVDEGMAYYGGTDSGFFGLAKGKVTKEEIIEVKKEMLKMKPEISEKLYSHHIFIFPFKWKMWDIDDDKASLYEKFNVKKFAQELENSSWERKEFELNHYDHYNEFNYFYDYVREVLYDLHSRVKSTNTDDDLINHFEYLLEEEKKYNIKLCGEDKLFSLEIDSILLNVYKTGTAALSIHLRNYTYPGKDDILKINKFGRRIYVPFFDLDPDSIITGKPDDTKQEKVLCATKRFEIPEAIWIGNPNLTEGDKKLLENFEQYRNKKFFSTGAFTLPKFIKGLFPEDFFIVRENEGYLDQEKKKKHTKYKISLMPVLDDRMHVVCWYGNTELVNELNQIQKCNDFDLGNYYINDNREKKNHYSYEESEWWYNYIFNDYPEPMHKDRFTRQKLLRENTYSRWVEWGTIYGFSRFSFVMLTSSFSNLERNNATYLVRHLQSMYYKMAELCLLQRATVLSFSDEVTHVSNLIDKDKEEQIIEKITHLYKHYILFVNKIYFREVTAQEQGIEMYDMMQRIMRIPSDVKDLDNEIGELNQFASMIAEKNETKAVNKLTRVATILLIPTLIAGLFGMNLLPETKDYPPFFFWLNSTWSPFWTILVIISIFTSICYLLLTKVFEKKLRRKIYERLQTYIQTKAAYAYYSLPA